MPTTDPVRVCSAPPIRILARPKSVIFGSPLVERPIPERQGVQYHICRRPAAERDENIRRLQVAMNDPTVVSDLHRPAKLRCQVGGGPGRQQTAAEVAGETPPFDILQSAIGHAVVLAKIVDLHDVGVLQARHGFHFNSESCQNLRLRMPSCQDHFQCNQSPELQVPGFVYHPHATVPKLLDDLKTGDVGRIFRRLWSGRRIPARAIGGWGFFLQPAKKRGVKLGPQNCLDRVGMINSRRAPLRPAGQRVQQSLARGAVFDMRLDEFVLLRVQSAGDGVLEFHGGRTR